MLWVTRSIRPTSPVTWSDLCRLENTCNILFSMLSWLVLGGDGSVP